MACKRSSVRPRYSPPEGGNDELLLFFLGSVQHEPMTDKPSLSKEGLGGLSILKVMRKAHRFDPDILHQSGNLKGLSLFLLVGLQKGSLRATKGH